VTERRGTYAVVLGVATAAAGIGVFYLGGLCGFQADAVRAAECADRWNLGGGVLTAVGLGLIVVGVRLRSRSAD